MQTGNFFKVTRQVILTNNYMESHIEDSILGINYSLRHINDVTVCHLIFSNRFKVLLKSKTNNSPDASIGTFKVNRHARVVKMSAQLEYFWPIFSQVPTV